MVCANVASDSPMVVSDPLGGFYYLWWDPYANQLVLAPECLEMRKIIGQTYDAFAAGQPTTITADFLNMMQEETLHMLEVSTGIEIEPQSLSDRADHKRLVSAIELAMSQPPEVCQPPYPYVNSQRECQ